MFIGKYNRSVIITYLGTISAVTSIFFALNGDVSIAFVAYLVATICDLFDGMFARMCKRTEEEKEFGVQLDSLADMISFVALPIILGYSIGMNRWFYIPIFALYAICGIIRLAYFNITKLTNGCYSGLPVTCSIIIFLPVYCLHYILNCDLFIAIYAISMVVTALLFILNFKVKKPSKKWYPLFTIAAVVTAIALIIGG